MTLPGAGGAAWSDDDDEFAQGPHGDLLENAYIKQYPRTEGSTDHFGHAQRQAENPAQDTHLVAVTGQRLGRGIGGAHSQYVQEQRECHVEQRQVASLCLETPLDRQETQPIWTGGKRGQETGQGSAQVETTTRLEQVGGEGSL